MLAGSWVQVSEILGGLSLGWDSGAETRYPQRGPLLPEAFLVSTHNRFFSGVGWGW